MPRRGNLVRRRTQLADVSLAVDDDDEPLVKTVRASVEAIVDGEDGMWEMEGEVRGVFTPEYFWWCQRVETRQAKQRQITVRFSPTRVCSLLAFLLCLLSYDSQPLTSHGAIPTTNMSTSTLLPGQPIPVPRGPAPQLGGGTYQRDGQIRASVVGVPQFQGSVRPSLLLTLWQPQ